MQRKSPWLRGSWLALVALSACGGEDKPLPHYPGCENAGDIGIIPATPASDAGVGSNADFSDERSLFDNRVQQDMATCRTCHVPGAIGDTTAAEPFLLTANGRGDYDALRAYWTAVGGGVADNLLLLKASGTATGGHSGGRIWPTDSDRYSELHALLTCWATPASCSEVLSNLKLRGAAPESFPLLGDLQANGGRNYAAVYCEEKPDCATLPQDPRELIAGENIENTDYAVYFNDPFEICETDALFANQARGNAILVESGKAPAYTAKPRPKTCGEWRAAVDRGREYIVSNPITGAVLTVQSLLNLAVELELPVVDLDTTNASLEQISQQRYGWPRSPYRNPAPLPGEDPNTTDGGSLQLPIALVQVKDAEGLWTGKLGVTCFGCHVGQIGQGEVVGNSATRDGHPEIYGGSPNGLFLGMNGSNTDVGTALWDLERANGVVGPNSFNAVLANPPYIANRTRGTNAADQEIFTLLAGRDPDTLDWRSALFAPPNGKYLPTPRAAGGDQDVPTWWWTHNKTRYLWVGYGSSGSSRGNYFPASTNPYDGHWSKQREGDFQDMDMWLNSLEAPKFVGPAIDTALAEQGAILFHAKDLWAGTDNAEIPRPPGGNGSCAGCHGAYSPRFIHTAGYLPDPRLAGMSGYTVPLEILNTDPEQSQVFEGVGRDRESVSNISGTLWMSYPDAQEGYRMPEERASGEGPFPADVTTIQGKQCGLGAKGGYTAQPLHGVWASAPYFHNGSVPTVWDVLSPATRPALWRRQQVPDSEASAAFDNRGYDTRLDRAYDYEKLGWKYEVLSCDASDTAPYQTSCVVGHDLMSVPDPITVVDDRAIYNTYGFSKDNHGHDWTQVLTDDERRALIEYMKTL